MPRPFIRHYAVGAPTTAADGTVQSAELILPAPKLDYSLGRICGLGQDVLLDHLLRIYLIEGADSKPEQPMTLQSNPPYRETLVFECPPVPAERAQAQRRDEDRSLNFSGSKQSREGEVRRPDADLAVRH
jgi:hypothetical protein